ncbi:Cell division protein FtsX [bioreactor metagenome]|uniref:Cell division protein FtsX n=1 Tax=bioreactor metagenome TaxID=1076179 RepID=A0A644X967_9ZZZZ
MINSISSFVSVVRIAGLILFVVFIGVSIFLITNTTKITVYSRRKEVGIMKFVGATDWFIRWPFIIEGMIIGMVGSLLSSVLLFTLYKWAYGYIVSNMFLVTLVTPSFVLGTLTWLFLVGGILVGAAGSIVALRKFLDV